MKSPYAATFCLSVILCIASASKADNGPDYPHNLYMTNTSSDIFDMITGSCAHKSETTITCNFVQTMIRHETDPKTISSKVEETVAHLKEESKHEGHSTWKKLGKNLDFCNSELDAELKKYLTDKVSNPHQLAVSQKSYNALMMLCDIKDEESYRAALNAILEVEAMTCKVWNNHFTLEFTYDYFSGNWLSKTGPSVDCGIMNIITLYETPGQEGLGLLWTYEQHRVVSNKKGKGILGSCADRDIAPLKYQTSDEKHFMHCEYVEYGL